MRLKRVHGRAYIARAEPDSTRAETRFCLSPKRTSPFKSVGASIQSTVGSRGVRISFSNAGYTTFGGGVRVLATHSIRQFPRHFPLGASPCATRFRTSSNCEMEWTEGSVTELIETQRQCQPFLNRNGFPERFVFFRDFFSNQTNQKIKFTGRHSGEILL